MDRIAFLESPSFTAIELERRTEDNEGYTIEGVES